MNSLKWLVFTALFTAPLVTHAQSTPVADTLLDHMAGKWLLKGTIAGNQVAHDIAAAWTLGHQYMELKETSREKKVNGTPVYEATVFITWDKAKQQYDCLWLDNTSNAGLSNGIIAHAAAKPNVIALLFTFNDHSYFHTTLTYTGDAWHWLMAGDDNGQINVFADAVMRRIL